MLTKKEADWLRTWNHKTAPDMPDAVYVSFRDRGLIFGSTITAWGIEALREYDALYAEEEVFILDKGTTYRIGPPCGSKQQRQCRGWVKPEEWHSPEVPIGTWVLSGRDGVENAFRSTVVMPRSPADEIATRYGMWLKGSRLWTGCRAKGCEDPCKCDDVPAESPSDRDDAHDDESVSIQTDHIADAGVFTAEQRMFALMLRSEILRKAEDRPERFWDCVRTAWNDTKYTDERLRCEFLAIAASGQLILP